MKYKLIIIFSIQLFVSTFSFADDKLEQLKNISNAGAPFLTLKMLDQAQPSLDADLYNWILWEQERYAILEQWQQWNELLIRIESLPNDLPEQFKHQLVSKQAKAYLALGQTNTARKILRPYLWSPEAVISNEYMTWRKMIVDSYIKDKRFDDARIAMRRFQLDFNQQDASWLENRALILIQSNYLNEAAELLASTNEEHLRPLSLYVDYLTEKKSASSVWSEATQLAKQHEVNSKFYAMYWMVALKSTAKMSAVDRVIAHEKIMQTEHHYFNKLLSVENDALWSAYEEYAHIVGNRAELLQGDDERWFELAKNATKITPVKARSLFAYLILQSSNEKIREQAATEYLNTLDLEEAESQNILSALFHAKGRFSQVMSIPVSVRFQLVDLALKKINIVEATRLMSGLEEHPENTDLFAWQLRRARVLILGGQTVEGHSVIQQLLSTYTEIETKKTDRILQILFDLQTVEAHQDVLISFRALLGLEIDAKQKREILFWMADSYKALKEHNKAALLYLQSAFYYGAEAMDPWAQTARYSAAESLQAAGLSDDARRIFESLLKVTKSASRKATLRHKIQQLWLTQSF